MENNVCEHSVCIYVENREFVNFFTEYEVYDIVWKFVYDKYLEYMNDKDMVFDFSPKDYVEEYCLCNVETGFEEFEYCPDCGAKIDFATVKKHINDKICAILLSLPRKKQKRTMPKYDNGYVYLVKLDKHYKIGISLTPDSRLKEFTLLPYPLEYICIEKVYSYKQIEKELHRIYASKNVRGEWFELNDDDVKSIVEYITARKIVE